MAQVPSNLIPVSVSQLPVDPAPSDQSWIMVNNGGVSYRVQAVDLLSVSGVPTSRQVIAGTGLQGGGALSSNVTLSVAPGGISDTELSATGATAGTFGSATKSAVFGVNAEGRIETTNEVDITPNVTLATGVLPLNRGGTGKSQSASPGAIAYSDVTGVALSSVGAAGQVLVSGGTDAPTWGSALVISDQNANVVYAGPASAPAGATAFRALVNADLPSSGAIANTYGSSTKSAAVTINAKGIVTSATESTITPAFSDITSKPTTLAGYGITDAQPLDATLTSLAALTTSADKLPYFTDVDTASTTTITSFARTLLDDTTATAARSTMSAAVTGANDDITSLTAVSGGISSPDFIQFDTTPETVPTATGALYWDSSDGNQTLSLVMTGGNAIQQIGQETYYRIKASATITEGQVVMFTGTVGASGALTGAPASGLTAFQSEYVMGVATENIANNAWGYVTWFGLVRGINTTGGAEGWVDGQVLYYNPAVAGGLTKTVPTAPNPKVIVASVVHAASNGSLFIRPTFGSAFGAIDSNVELVSVANNDFIVYNSSNSRWENYSASEAKTAMGLDTITGGAF